MGAYLSREQSRETFEPWFSIVVGGAPLDKEVMKLVTQVEVTDHEKEASKASFSLESHDLSVVAMFNKGDDVIIQGGYVKNHKELFIGKIESVEPNYPESGPITISVSCFDETVAAAKKKKKRVFKDKTVKQVVEEVAGENGWSVQADDTGDKKEQISQEAISDMQFLRRLADEEGFECWLDGKTKTLHFEKRKEESSGLTYSYRTNDKKLLSFSPKEEDSKEKDVEDSTVDPDKKTREDAGGGKSGGGGKGGGGGGKGKTPSPPKPPTKLASVF